MQLSEYNGWENKFTWLLHLHLSNEQGLMQTVTELVAALPDEQVAGWRLAMWVKIMLENWLTNFAGRNWSADDAMQLLVWDMVGSALAYADWDVLVRLLMGERVETENLFTMTLYQSMLSCPEWQEQCAVLLHVTASVYSCADVLKAWVKETVDTWMDTTSARYQRGSPVTALVSGLLANTCEVTCWQHVARAFRVGYWGWEK